MLPHPTAPRHDKAMAAKKEVARFGRAFFDLTPLFYTKSRASREIGFPIDASRRTALDGAWAWQRHFQSSPTAPRRNDVEQASGSSASERNAQPDRALGESAEKLRALRS